MTRMWYEVRWWWWFLTGPSVRNLERGAFDQWFNREPDFHGTYPKRKR